MAKLEFFFDISSPWTYLAFTNVVPLAKEFSTSIDWRPFVVGGLFNTINPSVYQARENPVPAKVAYQKKDIADWARHTGIDIKWMPTVFPVNSVKAMRGCLVAERAGKIELMAEALFKAYWGEDKDISQDDVLTAVCDRIGFNKNVFFAGIAEPVIKKQLLDNSEELMRRGGFGTPTMFVNTTDMYFGNDRLPLVREALKRAR